MEEISDLKPVLIKMKCDRCKEGYMKRANGNILLSSPPQYEHVCDNCGARVNYFKSYPYVDFVDCNTGKLAFDKEEN